jgi:hypothetical protein
VDFDEGFSRVDDEIRAICWDQWWLRLVS